MAGITSDANTLIDYARRVYQQYALNYGEPMPIEQLVQHVCNMKQSYTQHGGKDTNLFKTHKDSHILTLLIIYLRYETFWC